MTEREALKLALEALKQIDEAMPFPVAKLAQAVIKEALAQPEQEPVACVTYKEVADTMNGLWGGTIVQRQIAEELENTMLYTTPPQRKPLSDEEILTYKYMIDWTAEWSYINFARAIEAAHGIKGEA